MGLFSFLKDAGAKLFGHKKVEAAAPSAEEIKANKEAELTKIVSDLGLAITDFSVVFEDATDTVTVFGKTETNEIREKVILAVGNVEGVAVVDDNIEVAYPEEEADFYTVVKGDSLSKISGKYYGDVMLYDDIFQANRPMLTSPDLIYPGQVLRIPKKK